VATLVLSVVTQEQTAPEAVAANARAADEFIRGMRALNLGDRALQTAGFSVEPQSEREAGRPPRIVGYRVVNTFTLRLRELGRLGEVFDRAIELGANSVSGPSFDHTDPAARNEARRAASADGLARARLHAEALGVRLGRILSVSDEATPPPPPRPAMRGAAAGQVESPELVIGASVTITWAIEP
jgi:hypothetical protein